MMPYADSVKRNANRKKRYHERKSDPAFLQMKVRHVQAYQKRNPAKTKAYSWKSKLKNKYGISVKQYEDMKYVQNGLCAICKGVPTNKKGIVVDHDHSTGKVRELLCGQCNSMLGYARDNATILLSAVSYLEKHNAL